jgi:hypothetical protein
LVPSGAGLLQLNAGLVGVFVDLDRYFLWFFRSLLWTVYRLRFALFFIWVLLRWIEQ